MQLAPLCPLLAACLLQQVVNTLFTWLFAYLLTCLLAYLLTRSLTYCAACSRSELVSRCAWMGRVRVSVRVRRLTLRLEGSWRIKTGVTRGD